MFKWILREGQEAFGWVATSLGGGRLILLRVTLKLRRGPRALAVRLGMGGLVQEGGLGGSVGALCAVGLGCQRRWQRAGVQPDR